MGLFDGLNLFGNQLGNINPNNIAPPQPLQTQVMPVAAQAPGMVPGQYNPDDPNNLNPDGSMKAPQFNSQLGADGRFSTPGFNFNPTTVDPSGLKGFSQFGQEAMRTGPSQFATLQNQLANNNAASQMGKVGAQGAGSLMQSLNALGSRGNRGGAGALLAADNMKNQMFSKQGVNADLQKNLLNIASTDEQNRVGQLGAFSDAEAKLAGANANIMNQGNQFNIQNQLGELGGQRQQNQFVYGEGMKKWAADRTAAAMENSANAAKGGGGMFGGIDPLNPVGSMVGKKFGNTAGFLANPLGAGLSSIGSSLGIGGGGGGCFLTTAATQIMGLEDDCWVLNDARKFRDTYMTETPERAAEIQEYYVCAPAVVEKLNQSGEASRLWKRLFWQNIIPFVLLVRDGKMEEAHVEYKKLINEAKKMAGV